MIKLTNKKEIKGDLLFLEGGSGPQPGNDVAWLTPTILALLGIEDGKPYKIDDAGYVEFYFFCKMEHTPTVSIKMDGIEAANIDSESVLLIDEWVIQVFIEEGFPEEVINEFRTYIGYNVMLGYGEVPIQTTGTHSITLKVDNLVYTDIIDYSNAFNYVTYVKGNSIQQPNEPARSTGEYYTHIQRITVEDSPQLGVLAPDGYYYFLVGNGLSDYYVKVPRPLDVGDEISVDGVTINGYFNPDYKLPHIPTSVANYLYTISIYNAHPTSQYVEGVECQWKNSNDISGYYQLDGVGNMNKDDVLKLPNWMYDTYFTDFDIELELVEDITNKQDYWRLLGHNANSNYFRIFITSGNIVFYPGNATLSLTAAEQKKGAILHIKLNRNTLSCNGRTVNVTRSGSIAYSGIGLFQYYNNNNPAYGTKMKIHYVKWYNNGNLEHNLVPGIYAQLHTIDTDYGHSAFYDTVSGEWVGTDLFLTQGNIAQPVCLSYNTPIGRRNFTEIPNKLALTLPETYDGSPAGFGQQTSYIQYEYPTTAEYGMAVAYVGSWDEILAHSVMSSDGVLTYTPIEPLNNIYADGYSITGLNHPTGSSAQAVIDQVKFPKGEGGEFTPWTYPTGCVFTDTDGVKKILIGPLNTPGGEYTINAYRKYIKDHYSTSGIAIAYGTTGDIYHYANVYDPLWKKTKGDDVNFITTVQPSYSEIGTIIGN